MYCDELRLTGSGGANRVIQEFGRTASVPVINMGCDRFHPCQALADLFTIQQKRGGLKGRSFAYIGDGNNMANSLIEACAKVGMDITLACPKGYEPDTGIVREAAREAEQAGAHVTVVQDPYEAVKGADVVYTDVWASMGQEAEHAKRVKAFKGYEVDAKLLKAAGSGALVMHCLPAHRGEEISAEVIDGPQSIVFDQEQLRDHEFVPSNGSHKGQTDAA